MTQRAVEIVVGRLATDEALRARFRQAPSEVLGELTEIGLELSAVELAALQALDPAALQQFATRLDGRLQKAALVERPSGRPRAQRAGGRAAGLGGEREEHRGAGADGPGDPAETAPQEDEA
jgi:hypothetical protein